MRPVRARPSSPVLMCPPMLWRSTCGTKTAPRISFLSMPPLLRLGLSSGFLARTLASTSTKVSPLSALSLCALARSVPASRSSLSACQTAVPVTPARCPHARLNSSMSQPQPVEAPLTSFATFLTLRVKRTRGAVDTVRDTVSGISDLVKTVGFRDRSAHVSCIVGIGSDIWDELTHLPRPAELHPFKEVRGAKHTAPSTPGDLLFHIRAERADMAFEFEKQLLAALQGAVDVVDETSGFRYYDARDLLGFVDGTANPVGEPDVPDATLVSPSEATTAGTAAVGGSYVVVQKYVHDMSAWGKLKTEEQEKIIGRTKFDNVELPDAPEGKQQSHKTLNTIEQDGEEMAILRDNMPFGRPGHGEFGTYFIGYTRRLWVLEKMLERMFVGSPPGLHDRILDFSSPLTGVTFFCPASDVLEQLGE